MGILTGKKMKRGLRIMLAICMLSGMLAPWSAGKQVDAATSSKQNKVSSSSTKAVKMDPKWIYQKKQKSYALFVNGVEQVGPGYNDYETPLFYLNGTVYVPLQHIVMGMGGTFKYWSDKLTEITYWMNDKGDIWNFKWDGVRRESAIFLGNHQQAEDQSDTIRGIQKNVLYVPLNFIERFYPVTVMKEKDTALILVGDVPKNPTANFFGVKGQYPTTFNFNPLDPKQAYPGDWKAPQLTAKWSSDETKNFKAFEEQLGFKEGRSFGIPGQSKAIFLFGKGGTLHNGGEVMIRLTMWGSPPGVPDTQVSNSYKIPVMSAQLFKFYFGNDWRKVWNYFNRNDIPDKFTANGRTVWADWVEVDASLYLTIGKKTAKSK